jgi:hypothetical protein
MTKPRQTKADPVMNNDSAGGAAPLLLTTARWYNGTRRKDGRKAKILAATGFYSRFAYGTDTPCDHVAKDTTMADGLFQVAIICCPGSGVIAIDVDRPAAWDASATARHAVQEWASTRRWDAAQGRHRFHILIDSRAVPRDQWPAQSWTAWGDIKSCGFVPWPGSLHHSGQRYEPARSDGAPVVIPATPGLMAAIAADIAARPPRETGGGAGTGGGHDGEMAAYAMRLALDGKDEDAARRLWQAKACREEDPDWPYDEGDFQRHWRGGHRKAAEILARRAREAQWQAACLAITANRRTS